MPFDPSNFIAEILGEPATQMRNPANAEYRCPLINSTCVKRSQGLEGSNPYPVCTLWRWKGRKLKTSELMCVCPKRFFEVEILQEVIARCWPGDLPANPQYVHEIKMAEFGNVDLVIADVDDNGKVKQFVSVELQALDITGSVLPAYLALVNSLELDAPPKYGFNFANVYKRYVTQLIAKGYYHHHWGTKIISVVQDVVLADIERRTNFPSVSLDQANIVFMALKYISSPDGHYNLAVDRVVGTHHTNLQNAILYRTPPSKQQFCARIEMQLRRGYRGKPKDLVIDDEQ